MRNALLAVSLGLLGFLGTPDTANAGHQCSKVPVAAYERYASKVYDRPHVSWKAKRKLNRMVRCSTSVRRARAVRTRLLRNRCKQSKPVNCIALAARTHRVSLGMLKQKAWCESRYNPRAVNGPHAGLFQFRIGYPSTWATTPYAQRSPWSARWNALAAAWMHKVGRGGEWACR